jgi:hypothetical protein
MSEKSKPQTEAEVSKTMNRRQFLTGLGLAGASAATVGLAACSPSGGGEDASGKAGTSGLDASGEMAATSSNSLAQSQGILTWLPAEPQIADADVKLEQSADVVIIGCGLAGTTAARSAAEEGASVIVIEKSESPAVCRSGDYAVIGGEAMATWGRGDGYIDGEIIVDHEMDEMCYYPKRAILSKWAKGCGKVFDWYIGALPSLYICKNSPDSIPADAECALWPWFYPLPEGYDYKNEKHPTYPTSVGFNPDQGPVLRANWAEAENAGAQCLTGHFAEKLIKDGDKVVGVYARNAEAGGYVKITANKSVILATGEYASNKDILAYYAPETILNDVPSMWMNMDVEGNPTNTGDGLKMGAWINAAIQEHHAPMIHYMGSMTSVGTSPYLRLDLNGRRFMDEDVPGQQVQNATESLPGKSFWTIWDSKWTEQIPAFQPMHGSVNYIVDKPTPENYVVMGVNPYVTADACDKAAQGETPSIIKADSIDALLGQMPSLRNKAAAKASIERYNQMAKAGLDEDFNKTPNRMFPIESGPFYAFESGMSAMLVCCGGLVSDEECHVYDNDGAIIPGLYAAGNIQGNRYAVAYPIALKGISHSLCMFYGYIAGKNAVAEI